MIRLPGVVRVWTVLLLLGVCGLIPGVALPAGQPGIPVYRVCFNYDCNRERSVRLSAGEWRVIAAQFEPLPRSAAEERDSIRRAIAIFEYLSGTHTPTHRDRGGNAIPEDMLGQMDCIDESINTSTYLGLLQAHGLLRWHRVLERVRRAPYWVDVHWAGQIVENGTGARYAVDSWFLDNGEMPYIQALNDWLRKAPLD